MKEKIQLLEKISIIMKEKTDWRVRRTRALLIGTLTALLEKKH